MESGICTFKYQLKDILEKLVKQRDMIFQLNCAPIHNIVAVGEWLIAIFPHKRLGRNSPLLHRPPRLPDTDEHFPLGYYQRKSLSVVAKECK